MSLNRKHTKESINKIKHTKSLTPHWNTDNTLYEFVNVYDCIYIKCKRIELQKRYKLNKTETYYLINKTKKKVIKGWVLLTNLQWVLNNRKGYKYSKQFPELKHLYIDNKK